MTTIEDYEAYLRGKEDELKKQCQDFLEKNRAKLDGECRDFYNKLVAGAKKQQEDSIKRVYVRYQEFVIKSQKSGNETFLEIGKSNLERDLRSTDNIIKSMFVSFKNVFQF